MPSASATGSAKVAENPHPLSSEELRKVHAYWRAANYLSVGQIYLLANPLLREPLARSNTSSPGFWDIGVRHPGKISSMFTSIA